MSSGVIGHCSGESEGESEWRVKGRTKRTKHRNGKNKGQKIRGVIGEFFGVWPEGSDFELSEIAGGR